LVAPPAAARGCGRCGREVVVVEALLLREREAGRMGRTKARVVVGKAAASSSTARVTRSRVGWLCVFCRLLEVVVVCLIIVRRWEARRRGQAGG